ncbi:MAG: molybdopterin dehydrogenase, partial [Planctomycetes bacterium]|nr:molybdopterin dehydrogenase [Planctomycetota bacterium]
VTLSDVANHPLVQEYTSLHDVIDGIRAVQVQSSGTIGGDLCHLPNCWYFRGGYGLLAYEKGVSLPEAGDNRYHAIFGNAGPAKFVNASRFAPGLIAMGAKVRVIGPKTSQAEWVPLEFFYITPKTNSQGNTVLKPGQLISHLWVPELKGRRTATYEVLQMEGLDWPLASAGVSVDVENGVVRDAQIVLGHVAPVPWVARQASRLLVGRTLNEEMAKMVADVAVSDATPLSMNEYKVQIARTAVKRALLKTIDV